MKSVCVCVCTVLCLRVEEIKIARAVKHRANYHVLYLSLYLHGITKCIS